MSIQKRRRERAAGGEPHHQLLPVAEGLAYQPFQRPFGREAPGVEHSHPVCDGGDILPVVTDQEDRCIAGAKTVDQATDHRAGFDV